MTEKIGPFRAEIFMDDEYVVHVRIFVVDLLHMHGGVIRKIVRAGNKSSARINLPKDWEGKEVLLVSGGTTVNRSIR